MDGQVMDHLLPPANDESDAALEERASWHAEALTDESLAEFSKAAEARWVGVAEQAKATFRLSTIMAAGGVAFGLLGGASALVVHIKQPVPEPPGYILVDKQAGEITGPVPAKDVPAVFPETVRQRALRDFITSCQSYIPQTWSAIDYHQCMLFASPEEQTRLAEDMGKTTSPLYPPALFGPQGWAMPIDFPSYQLKGTAGDGPNKTWHYEVRYKRKEIVNGQDHSGWYTAEIYVQFHPELKMRLQDRAINPSGAQAISFSTVRE